MIATVKIKHRIYLISLLFLALSGANICLSLWLGNVFLLIFH